MKKTLLFTMLALSINANAQTPDYLWAKSAGGTSNDMGKSCSTDANGNLITTGSFYSSSITFGTTTLTNAGFANMFIVKYDSSGNVLWAKSAGGTSDDRGESCSTDPSGNIIATGIFNSPSITFGSTTLTNADSTGNTWDMFIVKYDSNGNVLWAKSTGGTSNDMGKSCSTDANGNLITTGSFYSSSITFGTTTLTNSGGYDMFIVKYDSNGNVLWAKSAGGTDWDEGESCSTDTSGNIIATGYFYSSSIVFGTTTLINAGSTDIFIVKYDPNGNVLWAKSAGGTSNDYGYSCSTDASENIIVTGSFFSSSITFGTTTLTNSGGYDMFIVKYDSNGNVLWAKSAGGTSYDGGISCATDAYGNIITMGRFDGNSITFGATTLTNAGTYNMFIVKYDSNGNVLWAKSTGGTTNTLNYSCATTTNGNIIATGSFSSSSITFGTTTLTNTGAYDIFILQLSGCAPIIISQSPSICQGQIITVGGHTYFASGTYLDTLTTPYGCDSIVTTYLTVNPLPSVSIDTMPSFININATLLTLIGYPTGGTFSGQGINGNNFNPSAAGLGTKTINYFYTDSNGCSNSASQNTIVYDTLGNYCYDTIPVYDTTFVTVNDTVPIYDTTFVTVNDTIPVYDTTFVTVNDTIQIYDTTFVTINDTVPVYDTTFVTINDTVSVYDTTFVTVNDTNYVTIYDSIAVTDTLIIDVNTGLNPPENVNTIMVYPNPAKTHITIDNGNYALLTGYKISIENSLSQQVWFSLLNQQQFYIDITTWGGSGTYFVKIINQTNNVVDVRKIVLQ